MNQNGRGRRVLFVTGIANQENAQSVSSSGLCHSAVRHIGISLLIRI